MSFRKFRLNEVSDINPFNYAAIYFVSYVAMRFIVHNLSIVHECTIDQIATIINRNINDGNLPKIGLNDGDLLGQVKENVIKQIKNNTYGVLSTEYMHYFIVPLEENSFSIDDI